MGSEKPTLLELKSGTRLSQERYEVLCPLYSTNNFDYPVEFSAFVVLDIRYEIYLFLLSIPEDYARCLANRFTGHRNANVYKLCAAKPRMLRPQKCLMISNRG